MLMPMHQQMLQQLQAAGTGASFDAAYKQAQTMSHQEALNLHTNYAQSGDVPALRQVAGSAVPVVQQHLQQAQVLNVTPMMGNDGSMGQQPASSGSGRAGERG
jgi:putative membrane protein